MRSATVEIHSWPEETAGIKGYTSRELRRIFREHLSVELSTGAPVSDPIVLGTGEDNPVLARLLREGFLTPPKHQQGYAMRCGPHPADPGRRVLAIAGRDPAGALYALRDLEHYCLDNFQVAGDRLIMEDFARCEWPRIEHRGHWVWGCNMPDKKAWVENMSRWKLNELIHWDNHLPTRAGEYVEFAHERGVRVVWGFGWGWIPQWNFELPAEFDRGRGEKVEMCPSSEFNIAFFRREILRKIRDEYAPTGCDGIYFQSFTECPKCRCPRCEKQTMGELMLRFVNPIVDDVKREFPDLWISCGVHHDFGDFSYLRELDPRCNIYWENCASGTSVRGDDEDFGYVHKGIFYGHGFSATCPADPEYTEESLAAWMAENAGKYVVPGGRTGHYQYMSFLQRWGARFLDKPSTHKHGCLVADHSVFCRRTPFPLTALAEAQWNPGLNTHLTVDRIISVLGMDVAVDHAPPADTVQYDTEGKPPWLCVQSAEREGHDQ